MSALRKKYAAPAVAEGSVIGSEDSWLDLGSHPEDDWSSLGGTPANSRAGGAVPASEGEFSELDLDCELAAMESPSQTPTIQFSTHHNLLCLNWYCTCAVASADEDCWCEELTGHLCEGCMHPSCNPCDEDEDE